MIPTHTEGKMRLYPYQSMLFKHKKIILFLFLGMTLFFAFHLSKISVESRTQMWFKKDDPHFVRYVKFKEEFGNDHILVVGISSGEIFTEEMEGYVKQITERLRVVKGVKSAINIFDFRDVQLRIEPVRKIIEDFFVSDNRQATQIIVHVTEEGSQFLRRKIIGEVKRIVNTGKPDDCEVYLSGSLFMGAELDRYARENAGKAILFTLAGLSLVLLVLYRKFSIMFSVLLTSLVVVIWAMGFYVAMGNALNLVTNMITPLVLILSIAVGIHIICCAQEKARCSLSWKEAVIQSVAHVWRPCLLASLTTSIGFFSLYFSPSKAISLFGLYAGLAMLMEFFIFFHIFPLILHSLYKPKFKKRQRQKQKQKRKSGDKWFDVLDWNARLLASSKNGIILVFLFTTAILAVGVLRISVNTNQLKYFSAENEIIKSAKFFDEFFGGVYPIQAVIVSPHKNAFRDQETMKKIRGFQEKAAKSCGLSREISLADVFFPVGDETISNELLAFYVRNNSNPFFDTLVDEEFRKTVVSFRAPSGVSSKNMMDIQSKLKNIAGTVLHGSNFRVELTGIMPLYAHFHEYIIKTQVISFSIAFSLVILIIGIIFRSLSLFLIVAFSNMTSIVMIFGLMGFIGINLDAGTVMIASCAIGIIVDDTIHILHRAGMELAKSGDDYHLALRRTITTKGKALVTTSLTIGLGFLVLLVNDFKPAKFFGILMAFTMFSALLADLFLLPSLIHRFQIKINGIQR
jgi:predicted RND superfamily exporter protein